MPFPGPLYKQRENHKEAYILYSFTRTVLVSGFLLSCLFWLSYYFRGVFFLYFWWQGSKGLNIAFAESYTRIFAPFVFFLAVLSFVRIIRCFDIKTKSIYWWHPSMNFQFFKGEFYTASIFLPFWFLIILSFPSHVAMFVCGFFKLSWSSKFVFGLLGFFFPYVYAFTSSIALISFIALLQAFFFRKSILFYKPDVNP